ncbi:putative [histone H3]-lysine(4) N-trimethyltransferase [Helianthus annuus]|uniref:Histone-lysine N-methyltransferase n=2 Tax=Helianthus annuus TaxID=4232 RepID=A0A9K3IEB2_HELAN|nr:histone-lysine N-methyltransferase, H3 lysine-9 specific SUVH6 isoform X1 [Helianthus annuus]XP_021977354.1 histone-lysine N-methyltransferase, H3 lysine-9 specific SUVH6 isoform X1 [Helianthus annuus]XP_035832092.1 histone-lysine N-methyltransferase, H3 lysine-9 specific SUVH6 isoform X1 [Helianthus annuus]KAF5795137.1 putative histone-lysine N-methyltransferase [Helianthus annuus]KAJ0546621.1 putative [histone H3]-lysine(4) N-trimethyltransferase [Helianthus annuus]KAJ0553316.1 putative [
MEILEMKSQPVMPRKRPLDGSNCCKHEEFRKYRNLVPAVRDFPPGCGLNGYNKPEEFRKYRKTVPAIRDFPPGCGVNEAERKPLKMLTKAHSDLGKMTSVGDDKILESNRVENNKFSGSKPLESGRNKSYVVSRPAGKVKYWDPSCSKAGYGQKPKVTITHEPQKKLTKNVNKADSNVKKMTPDGMDELVTSRPVENSKLKRFVPKELERSKSYLGSRSGAKVKYWDPMCEEVKKSEDTTTVVSQKENTRREKIKEALDVFDQVYEPFYQENRRKPKGEQISSWRIPTEAAEIVKRKLKWMDPGKVVGSVCGVQIGDKFKYRALLKMIGLHSQPQAGIDFAKIEGKNLAISIVDSQRYLNVSGSSDTLIYSGQGGHGLFGSKSPPKDQQLVSGNMAMKNSMDKKSPVRVIRKVASFGMDVFVYDGLYIVDRYTDNKNAEGNIEFKFHLKRIPGQPALHSMLKW